MKNSIIIFAILVSGLCSCQTKSDKASDSPSPSATSLGVNDSLVMRYVTCSRQIVDTLIAKGDSVYAQTNDYSIEHLGLDNENYNKRLAASYGDTIPAVVSIYDTYDIMTRYGDDNEINAAFVWHEVAKWQLTRFLQKDGHEVTDEDIGKVFHVIDGILDIYSGGTQYDMNMAAARWLLVADYRLLDSYKRVMDRFPAAEIKRLVHDDYKYLLDTSRKYMDYRYERDRYSDLPRELKCIFYNMLMAKAASINRLLRYGASELSVKKNLKDHICFQDGVSYRLTYDMLVDY